MRRYKPRNSQFAIDPDPADNGAHRNQNDWIGFFNGLKKAMMSAADAYKAGKSAPDELLDSLMDFDDLSRLILGTRTSYGDGLSGIVTQNCGSEVIKPSQTYVKVIPVYKGTPLAQAFQTEIGVSYVQAVFDTDDDPETIAKTLERLSRLLGAYKTALGTDRTALWKTALWTPDRDLRKKYPERAVGLGYIGDTFYVAGDHFPDADYGGLSRGMDLGKTVTTQ